MLQFKLTDGTEVHIEREAIEAKVLEEVINKVDEAKEKDAMLYSMVKSAVTGMLAIGKIDLKVPKGMNALEYLIIHYVGAGLDKLESLGALPVEGKIMPAAVQEEGEDIAAD